MRGICGEAIPDEVALHSGYLLKDASKRAVGVAGGHMSLFLVSGDKLERIPDTSFSNEGLLERRHLQSLLKQSLLIGQESPLGNDLKLICEEFCDWEESNRRIDLLCIDKEARVVVIELKRTEDGGHMELQAIRYAAMISSMTLEQAITAHARFLGGDDAQARATKDILSFLEFESTEDVELKDDVRIILAASNFSQELITSVLWLNKHDLDITCIRLKPSKLDDRILIDATQIVPLPEAGTYEIKIREKEQEARKVKSARQEILRRFWAQFIERSRSKTALFSNRSATTDHWLSAGIGRAGFTLSASLTEDRARIECFIRLQDGEQASLAAFNALRSQSKLIEEAFGGELDWQELPGRIGSRICKDLGGGWRAPEAEWLALQDQMIETIVRLEKALRSPIHQLD